MYMYINNLSCMGCLCLNKSYVAISSYRRNSVLISQYSNDDGPPCGGSELVLQMIVIKLVAY